MVDQNVLEQSGEEDYGNDIDVLDNDFGSHFSDSSQKSKRRNRMRLDAMLEQKRLREEVGDYEEFLDQGESFNKHSNIYFGYGYEE